MAERRLYKTSEAPATMPIGLPTSPQLDSVPGIRLGTANAGISKVDKEDLALIECASSTIAAAVFTKNRFCAAPVLLAKQHMSQTAPRALLVNSGNANAGTGKQGVQDAVQICEMVAERLGLTKEEVLPFSTGVIGNRLNVFGFEHALPDCIRSLREDNWLNAARAIMTTDTLPKGASRGFLLDEVAITLTGIVKGSGMIHPDMATMLSFIAMDVAVTRPVLDRLLRRSVEQSFNRITIDGDTSTNDACVLLATGCADMDPIQDESDPRYSILAQNVDLLLLELAQSVVRDGEGASKFVAIEVTGAVTQSDAQILAFAVAHSPLVKTALFASDPNWGRILAVVGRAEVGHLEIDKVGIFINDVAIVMNGEPANNYTEEAGQRAMAPEEINIRIDLGLGEADGVVWTSDLSYDYVKINAEYRS